jgi:hypothetical protein
VLTALVSFIINFKQTDERIKKGAPLGVAGSQAKITQLYSLQHIN